MHSEDLKLTTLLSCDQAVALAALDADVKLGTGYQPSQLEQSRLVNKKNLNMALPGALSHHLDFPVENWKAAIQRHLPEQLHEDLRAFALGKEAGNR